ncbi:MAG: hypothetical protein ACLPLR_05235 [Terriglobales bacterium]
MGIGDALRAGQVAVADGSGMMAKPIERGLATDLSVGVIRNLAARFDDPRELAAKNLAKLRMGE